MGIHRVVRKNAFTVTVEINVRWCWPAEVQPWWNDSGYLFLLLNSKRTLIFQQFVYIHLLEPTSLQVDRVSYRWVQTAEWLWVLGGWAGPFKQSSPCSSGGEAAQFVTGDLAPIESETPRTSNGPDAGERQLEGSSSEKRVPRTLVFHEVRVDIIALWQLPTDNPYLNIGFVLRPRICPNTAEEPEIVAKSLPNTESQLSSRRHMSVIDFACLWLGLKKIEQGVINERAVI